MLGGRGLCPLVSLKGQNRFLCIILWRQYYAFPRKISELSFTSNYKGKRDLQYVYLQT
jgi:hypothetical protein